MKFIITARLYQLLTGLILLFILGYFLPAAYAMAKPLALIVALLVAIDCWLLFGIRGTVETSRHCRERFSNGDENGVEIHVCNRYPFTVKAALYDELPFQFQIRDFRLTFRLKPSEQAIKTYFLKPVDRGTYGFGHVIALVATSLGLIARRIVHKDPLQVKVYPSFIRLHQYGLLAISSQLFMAGQKRVRKVGNSQEFDTIRDYVRGDDPRRINWPATARRGHLMSNHFIDERAQNLYCLIDKSRTMKMPFEQMTLLDYAINSSLVMADVSLKKGDKAGLLTFEDKVDTFVKAGNRNLQLHQLMEALYRQETSFREPDMPALYNFLRKNLNQRSLLLLYTNFESIHSLNRQLPYLKLVSRDHLLLVIYFQNTEVDHLLKKNASSTREIYDQAIAHQMINEKLLIRDTLSKAGILSLYTTPKNLNVNVINKYIEVKAKRML